MIAVTVMRAWWCIAQHMCNPFQFEFGHHVCLFVFHQPLQSQYKIKVKTLKQMYTQQSRDTSSQR